MSTFSTVLKIAGGVALTGAAVWVGTKVSPTFAEKVAHAGEVVKDMFTSGAEKAAEVTEAAAKSVTQTTEAVAEQATA